MGLILPAHLIFDTLGLESFYWYTVQMCFLKFCLKHSSNFTNLSASSNLANVPFFFHICLVEELVDNESSWKKAAGQNVDANIQEMRGMVPKSKPLGPNESDDVIIEEVIPDDPQAQPTSQQPTITGQDGAQNPPNSGCTTNLTQSDMEIFSLWNGN